MFQSASGHTHGLIDRQKNLAGSANKTIHSNPRWAKALIYGMKGRVEKAEHPRGLLRTTTSSCASRCPGIKVSTELSSTKSMARKAVPSSNTHTASLDASATAPRRRTGSRNKPSRCLTTYFPNRNLRSSTMRQWRPGGGGW